MLIQLHAGCCEVSTPAKLNLFLEVLGKRPDGYHELETLMVTVSLFDTLRFKPIFGSDITLRNHWCVNAQQEHGPNTTDRIVRPTLPDGPGNLVWKAADLISREAGINQGVQIDLFKRIPLEAGLAGGSSNAAATLVGLNRLWNLKLTQAELIVLGAQLGSDVPFFLANSAAAICRGRGEIVEPLKLQSTLHFAIAKPPVGLSTAQVFQKCQPAQSPRSGQDLVQSLHQGQPCEIGRQLFNRLGTPAEALCGDVAHLRQQFDGLPVCGHLMSGSGTSYFGLCQNQHQARQLAGRLRAARCGQVFVVQSCI